MRSAPRLPWLRLLFVLYCTQAGVLFLMLPWSIGWEATILEVPGVGLSLGLHPLLRGAVSGFGIVHLVWAAHDLEQLLSRQAERARRTPVS
jgi:hypothetical protein